MFHLGLTVRRKMAKISSTSFEQYSKTLVLSPSDILLFHVAWFQKLLDSNHIL